MYLVWHGVYDRQREIRVLYLDSVGANKIYDELCTCGCYRSQHDDTIELGHGKCFYCSCKQFTWAGFLVKESPALPVAEEVEVFLAQGRSIEEGKALAMPEKVR